MVHHIETIEEKVRNKLSPILNLKELITLIINDEEDLSLKDILYDETLIKAIDNNIQYLIKLAEVVDKHLPNGFNLDDYLNKETN